MHFDGWRGKELWNLAAIAWAAILAAGALVLEHGFGQLPCALCLNQRAWIMLAGLFVAAGFAHNPRLGIYPLLAVGASLAGGTFSIRHLYLLTLPADQVPGCGVDFDYIIDVFPVLDVLRHMAQGTGECTEQGFVIPAAALVGFVGMLALTITYWRRR